MDRIERGMYNTLVLAEAVDDLGTILRIGTDLQLYQVEKLEEALEGVEKWMK